MGELPRDLPRSSGVLLHPTSFPGTGIGDLGDAAYRFIDWLADAGQSLWQILPLVPVSGGGSPYNGLSAMAGNPLLVSPERLVEDGLLRPDDIEAEDFPAGRVDYPRVVRWKEQRLFRAYNRFRGGAARHLLPEFEAFRARSREWLDDYTLFRAVREAHDGAPWTEWEQPIRLREPGAVEEWHDRLGEATERYAFKQFLFEHQWSALREYANRRGVRIIGDIPIFVAHDSADVWAHRELFQLDETGQPLVVAGVPPDYFSETGQRWGNPIYAWEVMRERGFLWWTERFRRTFEQVDIVRVDHFRGFEAYWEIPAEEETAIRGRWCPGPGTALFDAVEARLGRLPIIAEDLGLITPEVDALREKLGFPGMRVLQFAFDGEADNPHLPANHPRHSVCYTGTHDNNTAAGWWECATPQERELVRRLLPEEADGIHWALIRLAFASPAKFAIVPLQDVLGLGAAARMNVPGTGPDNWEWRYGSAELTREVQDRLLEITRTTGRMRPTGREADHPEPAKHPS